MSLVQVLVICGVVLLTAELDPLAQDHGVIAAGPLRAWL